MKGLLRYRKKIRSFYNRDAIVLSYKKYHWNFIKMWLSLFYVNTTIYLLLFGVNILMQFYENANFATVSNYAPFTKT